MPPGIRPRLALLLLAVAALTCDDSRRDDPLSARVAAAYCGHQFLCCSPFEITMITSDRYKTEADCVPFATLAARQQLGTVEGAIAQGRITVDAARADACLAAYRDQACGSGAQAKMLPIPQVVSPALNTAEVLGLCPDMLVGHVPDGRACNLSLECVRGSRCVSGTSSVAGAGTGGAGGTLVATPGICTPYQQEGERCNQASDCDPARFGCHTPDYVCGPKPQRGDTCMLQLDLNGFPSSDCDESQGLQCDVFTSSCQPYPRDGQLCNTSSLQQCDPDPKLALTCNPITFTCRSPGEEGDPCGGLALPPCRRDLACRPTQPDGIGTCGAVPTLGGRCVDRCASPAICAGTTCVSPGTAAIGAPCALDAECRSMSCSGFQAGRRVCAVPPYNSVQCIGAGITAGTVAGSGVGGMGGAGGTIGRDGGVFPPTGTGGIDGSMPSPGCRFSAPPREPIIADFSSDSGGAAIVPIGGTFTYGTPMMPVATVVGGAWRVTLDAPGIDTPQFVGVGIYFDVDPVEMACVDATQFSGVQFDISGSVGGNGCTAQYATNDSVHTDNTLDPKGAGPAGSWSPQAPLTITATPQTVMMPFSGTGAPVGGNPQIPIDKSKLTGVVWQFTVGAGMTSRCLVDAVIDNVRFF